MQKPLAVLNIEDSESDSELIARLIKKAGYKLTIKRIETEAEMRKALKRRRWDVILSEHSLPQFDSYSALALLHESGVYIPFIVVSGKLDEETAVAVMKAGARDYLMKDNLTRLLPAMERELNNARARQEQKSADHILFANEKRFRALIENSLDDISLLSAEGTLLWESPSAIRNLGYPENEALGQNMFELVHPEDRELIQELFTQLVKKPDGRQTGSFRLKRSDGSWRWIEGVASNMLHDPDIQAIVINYRDITERKQTEEELGASEQLFRELVNNIEEVFWITGDEGRKNQYFSPSYKKLWGRALKGVDELMDSVLPEDRPVLSVALEKQKRGEKTEIEYRIKYKDGSVRWVWDRAFPIFDTVGKIKNVAGIASDITKRRRAEDSLRESEQKYRSLYALAERREQERALIDNVSTVLAHELDLTKILHTVVEAITKTFGYTLVSLYLLRDETLVLQHQVGYSHVLTEIPITDGISGRVARSGLPLLIEDVHTERAFVGAIENIVSEVCVPLLYKDQVIGILNVESTQNIKLSEADLNLMIALSEYISPAIERARLYTEIGQSERRFRALTENSADAITLLDARGFVTYDSPAAPGMLGYAPQERLGKSILELIHADDLPAVKDLLQKLTETNGARMCGIFRLRHKDNSWRWMEAVATNLLDEPSVKAIVVNYRDITERQQAEYALRASESSLQGILQSTADGILAVSSENKVLYANDQFAEMWKIPKEVISSKDDNILLHFVADQLINPDEFLGKIQALYKSAQDSFDNLYFKDGRTFERISKPIRTAETLTGRVWSFHDITQRKRTEEKLRLNQERFAQLANNTQDAFWIYDIKSGKVSYLNPAVESIWGKSVKELMASPTAFLETILPDDVESVKTAGLKHLVGEKTEIEYRVRQRDGSIHWIWDRAFPIQNDQGKVTQMAGFATDITERKELELALNRSEQAHRTLFENVPVCLYRTSADGRMLDANPAMVNTFGYQDRASFLELPVADLYADPASDKVFFNKIVNSDVVTSMEAEFRKKDGTTFWAEDHVRVIRDVNGNPLFYEGSLMDITARKLADKTLTESEEHYRKAIAAADAVPYSMTYAPDHYIHMGEGINKLTGLSAAELTSPAVLDTLIIESTMLGSFKGAPIEEAVRLVREGGTQDLWQCEHHIHTRTGEERWIIDSSIQVLDEHNIPTGSIGLFQDITERKQAELALQQSEEKYRALFQNSQVAMYRSKLDGSKMLAVNRKFCEIFGFGEEEMLENPATIRWADAAAREQMIGELRKTGSLQDYEVEILTKSGERRICSASAQIDIEQGLLEGSLIDITERKHAEDNLLDSEGKFRSFIEQSADGLAIFDEHGLVIEWNHALEQINGLPKSQALGKPIWEIQFNMLPLENRATVSLDRFRKSMLEMLKTGQSPLIGQTHEAAIQSLSGEKKYIQQISFPIKTDKGYRIGAIIRDISERKQAEEKLRESEDRFKAIFMQSPLGITVSDSITGHFFQVNPRYAEIAGRSMEEIATKDWLQITHPDDIQKDKDQMELMLAGKINGFQMEKRYLHADGSTVWINMTIAPLRTGDKDHPSHLCTIEDITARKLAEETLRKSEENYREAITAAGLVPYAIDYNTKQFTFIGENIFDLTGYSAAEFSQDILIDSVQESHFWESDPSGLAANELQKEFLSGKINKWGNDLRIRTKSGEERWLSDVSVPIIGKHGNATSAIGVFQDLTERKHAEEALKESEQRYRSLFEDMPVSIWEEDFSAAKKYIDSLKEQGVSDFRAYFDSNPEALVEGAAMIKIIDVNQATLKMYQADSKQELIESLEGDLNVYEVEHIRNALLAISEGKTSSTWESADDTMLGEPIQISLRWAVVPGYEDDFSKVIVTTIDVTERLKAEAENKYQLAELEALYENGLAISRLLEPKEIAQKMVQVIEQKLHWHHAAIRLYDESANRTDLLAFNSSDFDEAQIGAEINRINQINNNSEKSLSSWVIQHGEIVRLGNVKADPRYLETYAGINSGLYVPIKSGTVTIGSIAVESEQENAFSERDERTLATLANQAAISFINSRLYIHLQKELDERHRAENQIRQLNVELEQRVAERTAQIEATRRRLEIATEAGQIGVWEYSPKENQVIWDERMHHIHQIPVGGFDGTPQTWAKLIHPNDIDPQAESQDSILNNILSTNEHRILWPDGSVRHVMTSSITVHSPEGNPERIIGISMDITQRKQIEQSLRESETYARLLFDAIPDPISVTEADGTIMDVNPAFVNTYHLAGVETRGRRISDIGIFSEIEMEKRENYVAEVLKGHTSKPVELEFYVPGDRFHMLELHSYLLKVENRNLIFNTSHDITLHKRAEEIQRLAKSEMEDALRIKNEFLANMSHELRTPLNSILGISESLEEQIAGKLNEKQLKYIGIVRESGSHLLELINDILDLSKIEAGKMELDIHRISVEKLCQSSLRMVKELAQKKSLTISYKTTDNHFIVLGDERRLKQCIVNLLVNAVKFTSSGKEIGLEISPNAKNNVLGITVWDQGVGIAPQDIKRLFKPFVQLDAGLDREYQGSGLGLALIAQIVQLHNGHASVVSEPGKGSRFTITLPWLASEQSPKAIATGRLSDLKLKSNEKHTGRILLVEDTDVIAELTTEYLVHKGYEVILARNGVEGFKLAIQEHPDLILMDVMMPMMDGMEATKIIRKEKSLQNTPIIALTALAMAGDSDKCLAAGMNDYLSKPLQMQDLAEMIEKYLKPRQEKYNGK